MNREALTGPALEALLQAPSLAILAVDTKGCVILWSPSATRLFGWAESEAVGRFLPIVPEERRQEVHDRIQIELKGEIVSPLDLRRLRKDGSLIDVSLWTAPLRDNKGEVVGILGVYADITARKRAERALQEAEAELRRVLAAVPDYLYSGEFDSKGRFFYHYVSPAVQWVLGRPPGFFLADPARWLSTVHPQDRPRVGQASARLEAGQSSSEESEYRVVLPDGAVRWVRDKAAVSQGADGRRFINGVVSDITARKQAEVALRESELELRRVLDAASDYFWSGDVDSEGRFRYRYYSPAVEQITGRPAEFYMAGSQRWLSTVHPEDRARLAGISERMLRGQSDFSENEHRIVLPDGTIRWVRAKVTMSQSAEGHRRLDGVVSDITEHKRAEDRLRESEERYRTLAESAPDAIYIIDRDGRVQYVNTSAAGMLRTRPEQATGKPIKELFPPDSSGVQQREIDAVFESGQPRRIEDKIRLNGRELWLDMQFVPLRDAGGEVNGVMGISRDVTERKRVEERLEERVRERTAELAGAIEALRASEVRYRTLVEEIPAITYIAALDQASTTLYISPQVEDVLGLTPADHKANPDIWREHMHPDDRKRVMAELRRTQTKGEPFDCEYRMVHRNGGIVWIRDKAVVLPNEPGKPLFLHGVMFDVTERHQTEEAMRLQSTALAAAANSIVITDRDGGILWANPAFTKLTGYELAEVMGKDLRILRSGKHDEAFYRNLWQTPLSGRVWHGEIINKRKDGSLYTEEMTIAPVRDAAGEIAHFISIKQDITEWKSAEKSRRHLAAIVETSDDAIVSGDLNGRITSWNAGAQRLYHYAPEEILGRSVSVLIPPNRRREARETLKRIRRGERTQHFETVRLKKGGVPVDVSITVSSIKNDAGRVIGVSAITRDITERKELERAVVEATSREQARIGLDLHDGVCQQLTGIGFLWKTIERSVAAHALPDAAMVVETGQLITKTIREAPRPGSGILSGRIGKQRPRCRPQKPRLVDGTAVHGVLHGPVSTTGGAGR
jgi:PAS domain S-box-containing protein